MIKFYKIVSEISVPVSPKMLVCWKCVLVLGAVGYITHNDKPQQIHQSAVKKFFPLSMTLTVT